MYLLGAGASRGAGLPLARELTGRVLERFNNGAVPPQQAQALNFVVSAILAHHSRRGEDPQLLPDIETLVSSVELLGERDQVELAPFVQAWDPAVGAMDLDRQIQTERGRYLRSTMSTNSSSTFSDHAADDLSYFIRAEVGLVPGTTYQELLPALNQVLVEILKIEDSNAVSYLEPLAQLGAAPQGVSIATLNYDLSIETVAAALGVPCSTGLEACDCHERLVVARCVFAS